MLVVGWWEIWREHRFFCASQKNQSYLAKLVKDTFGTSNGVSLWSEHLSKGHQSGRGGRSRR